MRLQFPRHIQRNSPARRHWMGLSVCYDNRFHEHFTKGLPYSSRQMHSATLLLHVAQQNCDHIDDLR